MSKITKIDTVRNELSRIASHHDRADIFSPTMRACWSFPRVMVIGKLKMQAFDYDALLETLSQVPTGAGEMFFWNTVRAESLNGFGERAGVKSGVIIQLYQRGQLKKV